MQGTDRVIFQASPERNRHRLEAVPDSRRGKCIREQTGGKEVCLYVLHTLRVRIESESISIEWNNENLRLYRKRWRFFLYK
jgi:hypothetical protein